MWSEAMMAALSGPNLLYLFTGTLIGLVFGILPALGGLVAVVLVLPFTYNMSPVGAVILLLSIASSCAYGDSVASILLNIPGGPGTVATCWDGHPLARMGKAGMAMGIATLGSFLGGALAWLSLALLAGPITDLALEIGAPEFLALGLMALSLISVASAGETLRGLIMAAVGLAIATIGRDTIVGLVPRFSFGVMELEDGIPIGVFSLGVFGVSQVIALLEEGGTVAKVTAVSDSALAGFKEVVRRPLTVLRAGLVGWIVGIAPAMGTPLAGIAAYYTEKHYSPEGANFGKGSPAGLLAAEVGKGACVIGDMIPTFTLGIPGSAVGAVIMAALIMHGVQPGVPFMTSGLTPYVVFSGMLLGQAAYFVVGLFAVKWFAKLAHVPLVVVAPMVGALCFLGAYVERGRFFDVILMLGIGIVSYLLSKSGYSGACLLLGVIIGPIIEGYLHRSLMIQRGSWAIFVTRPISAVLIAITLLSLVVPYVVDYLRKKPGITADGRDPVGIAIPNKNLGRLELGLLLGLLVGLSLMALQLDQYGPQLTFFPRLVMIAGAFLIVTRLAGLLSALPRWTDVPQQPATGLPWMESGLHLVFFLAASFLVGLPIASGLYVGLVLLRAKYGPHRRKLLLSTVAAVSVGVFCYLLQAPIFTLISF